MGRGNKSKRSGREKILTFMLCATFPVDEDAYTEYCHHFTDLGQLVDQQQAADLVSGNFIVSVTNCKNVRDNTSERIIV